MQYLIRPGHSGPGETGADLPGIDRDEDPIVIRICQRVAELNPLCRAVQASRSGVALALGLQPEPCVVVEVHANTGKGRYALVAYHPGSPRGAAAASKLADSYRGLVADTRCEPATIDRWPRILACLMPYYRVSGRRCGILIEVGFLDSDAHAHLWTDDGIEQVAHAIAGGLT